MTTNRLNSSGNADETNRVPTPDQQGTRPKFPKLIRAAFERYPNVRSDRHVVSGAPCVANRRIPVYILARRFAAGEKMGFIARDYDLKVSDVQDAIRFVCWCSRLGDIKWWKFYE